MAHRKKTLRKMPPVTRKLAKLLAEYESVTRRIKNLLPAIEDLEVDSLALRKHSCLDTVKAAPGGGAQSMAEAMTEKELFKSPRIFKGR